MQVHAHGKEKSPAFSSHQMQRTAEHKQITAALAKAQSMYGVARKDEKLGNNFGNKMFASFPSVWEACVPALNACEIAVVDYQYWMFWHPEENGKKEILNVVVVELIHSSGEKLWSEMPAIPERQKAKTGNYVRSYMQDINAAATQAKRHLFQNLAFANIADEDHDTQSRENSNGQQQKQEQAEPQVDNSKVEKFNNKKKSFIDSCKEFDKLFADAGKTSRFKEIVKEVRGVDTLKGIADVNQMDKILVKLQEEADTFKEEKDEKPPAKKASTKKEDK